MTKVDVRDETEASAQEADPTGSRRATTGSPPLRAIDLFSGVGGLAIGAASAGFKVELLVEKDPGACRVLRGNIRPGQPIDSPGVVIEADLTTGFEFPPEFEGIDLLMAGPPCQPYSSGGKRNGQADLRDMFPSFFHAVQSLRPRAILVENVWGLTIGKFRDYFEYLLLRTAFPFASTSEEDWATRKQYLRNLRSWLEHHPETAQEQVAPDHTYDVWGEELNAADFGVPQVRRRAFIVAFRRDQRVSWSFPSGAHSRGALLRALREGGPYWQEHSGAKPCLPSHVISSLRALDRRGAGGLCADEALRWVTLREGLEPLPEPKERQVHPNFLNHVGVPGARLYPPNHNGSVLDWPAKTIKCGAHGIGGGENVVVREDGSARWLTVRECALLQGFPLEWDFGDETRSACMRYTGNAVPVPLARRLAESIELALNRQEVSCLGRAGQDAVAKGTA